MGVSQYEWETKKQRAKSISRRLCKAIFDFRFLIFDLKSQIANLKSKMSINRRAMVIYVLLICCNLTMLDFHVAQYYREAFAMPIVQGHYYKNTLQHIRDA